MCKSKKALISGDFAEVISIFLAVGIQKLGLEPLVRSYYERKRCDTTNIDKK